jgi:hypothetical protein
VERNERERSETGSDLKVDEDEWRRDRGASEPSQNPFTRKSRV